jgi:predicted methyltransferase
MEVAQEHLLEARDRNLQGTEVGQGASSKIKDEDVSLRVPDLHEHRASRLCLHNPRQTAAEDRNAYLAFHELLRPGLVDLVSDHFRRPHHCLSRQRQRSSCI